MAVREALQRVRSALSRLGYGPSACGLAEVVLAEVMNNVVEHAYDGAPDHWMLVEVRPQPGCVRMRVVDRGRAMPGGRPPAPPAQDLTVPVADLPEGGFGWLMIHEAVSNLTYTREGDANCLSFVLPLGAGGP